MKLHQIIVFVLIILTIFGLANFYVIKKIYNSIGQNLVILILLIILAASYPTGKIIERTVSGLLSRPFTYVGIYYTAFFINAFFTLIIFEIIKIIFSIMAKGIYTQFSVQLKNILFNIIPIIIAIIITITGYLNAFSIKIKNLKLDIYKNSGNIKSLKIALLSDIHLGLTISKSHLEKIVRKINDQNPNLVLIAGDLIDEDIFYIDDNILEPIKNLKAKYGIYACPGNHEYYAGFERAINFIKNNGINILADKIKLVENKFYIVGRHDKASIQIGIQRKPLSEVINDIDNQKPIILLDHTPIGLKEASDLNIDLQVSGHTHHGQIFPFNLITTLVYEKSWGYTKKGNTHFYISCGTGVWGPPIRTGSNSEITIINIYFKQNETFSH